VVNLSFSAQVLRLVIGIIFLSCISDQVDDMW